MADTVMRSALSCYGSPFIKTPNIDSLSSHSYKFENLYQPANMCMPSRSSWWTGYYQNKHQVFRNGQVFDRKVPTIFRALAEQNYYGGYLGLYHCWPGKEHDGLDNWSWLDYVEDHPYDTYEEKKKSLEAYAKEHGFYQTDQYLKDFKAQAGFTDFPIEHHSMGRITDKAINCINDFQDERPNALWVSYWMPHEPFAPPAPYHDMYSPDDVQLPSNHHDDLGSRPEHQRNPNFSNMIDIRDESDLKRVWAAYGGMMTFIDDQIGRIIQHLKERDLYDDSIIVFSTDHGTTMGAHGWMYKGQSYMLEEISHIPCLMKLPKQRERITVPDIVSNTDFTPTLLDLLDLPHEQCHGQSWQRDVFLGKPRENPYALGIYSGGPKEHDLDVRMLRKGDWKYNIYEKEGVEELYNITEDPLEMHNCAEDHPELCMASRAELKEILSKQEDNFHIW